VVDLPEGAVATSGTAERGAHVLNPHTGGAAIELASVTIVGPDLTVADVYATAALAMGSRAPAWLADLDGLASYVVDAGGNEWSSPGLSGLRADLHIADYQPALGTSPARPKTSVVG
jgi:thiamine biosynthesis lipoprotein